MKIYTYNNPFNLTREPYWDEIRKVPHFCVSQTLVQGLNRNYGRHAFNYITTADQIINALYPEWYKSVEMKIEQYVSISRQIEMMGSSNLAKSFKFNQQRIIDALRFSITLNLDANNFDTSKLPVEQTAFLAMLNTVKDEPCWKFDDDSQSYTERLEAAVQDIFISEMEETLSQITTEYNLEITKTDKLTDRIYACLETLDKKTEVSSSDETAKRYKRVLEHFTALAISKPKAIDKVVFHAIHQFTPKILSAVKRLEKSGIEVIFLLNYQKRYSHVYDTWKSVYEWTGLEFPEGKSENDYEDYRLIGECIGNLLEGRRSGDVDLESTVIAYQNRTQFADHVASRFADAVERSRGIHMALSNMDEQFYGVQSDEVNELLRFYFPEQFGDRQFLSYPIGQFILSLYQMWDEHDGLIVNDTLIRECLSVNIWSFHGATTPISVYEKLRGYITDLSEIGLIIERLEYLKTCIHQIKSKEINPIYNEFPFFNLSEYDVGYFIEILSDIKSIADELFSKSQGNTVDFRAHFQKLIGMIGMKMAGSKHITQAEISLVKEVQLRLSRLQTSRPIVGSIDDLKQTIHYYLQNETNDSGSHWIVRNFEQIDGGVLLSRYTHAKTYHFALLSDRNMKQANDEFFPWPITADLLESQENISQDSKTILMAYKEYRNFLRYSVFYGTYFLDSRKQIQFSFVEESDADKAIPYYILTLLGLVTKLPESKREGAGQTVPTESPKLKDEALDELIAQIGQAEQEIFVSCPYRFMLNFVLEESACFSESFDSRRLYSLLLFSETWQHNIGLPVAEISGKLAEENARLSPFFPFWKTVDFVDMVNTAYYYLAYKGMIKQGRLQEYQPDYVCRKMAFKDSRKAITQPMAYSPDGLKSYLRFTQTKEPVHPPVGEAESLCESCNQRNVCMRKYLLEE
ncbi:hypothetical protein [Dehalobacterium formicoaceticum]|uniref:hypothetical protein n=1 Tax=Dehalobacterium formicoaceticum TaxID=51515 RepID=UPI0031F64050